MPVVSLANMFGQMSTIFNASYSINFIQINIICLQLQTGSGLDQVPLDSQVDVLKPISVKPGLQTNVAIEPAIGRLTAFVDVAPVTVPFIKNGIGTQVAKRNKECFAVARICESFTGA